MFGQDYCDKFRPNDYLQKNYSVANLGPFHLFKLNALHKFYRSYSPTAKLRILDIGSGPSIASAISAAPYTAEIVLSDYTEANRSALLQWLNNDPNAFDWTHIFKYIVVDLEGKTEEEVPIRAELVHKVVTAIVPCDVNRDPSIPTQYMNQYDIVTDLLCLPAACATKEDYTAALVRLHALLKPGGKIVLYTPECKEAPIPASYGVGPHNFFALRLSRDVILKSLQHAGFHDVTTTEKTRDDLGIPDHFEADLVGLIFTTASKLS